MYSESESRINKVVETALKNLNGLADVSTVVGKPIKTEDGDYIFPLSKVTLGILSGGGEYGKITLFKKNSDLPFSAGNGSIISVKPCGFLIKISNSSLFLSISVDFICYMSYNRNDSEEAEALSKEE